MFTDYTMSFDETNHILHVLGLDEYLKIQGNPFSIERLDMNYPENGFQVYFPDDLNFQLIHRLINEAKRRFKYTDKIVQIFHPFNTKDIEITPEIKEQQEKASLFNLWRFTSQIDYKHLIQTIRFGHSHTKILYVLDLCPEMIDLAKSNPGLMYYLIVKHEFSPKSIDKTIRSLKHLVKMKQKAIAISFDLPPKLLNILKRIDPRALCHEEIIRFIDYLNKNTYPKYVHHLKKINLSHMRILCDDNLRAHVTPMYMQDLVRLSHKTHELDIADFLQQLISNAKKYNIKIPNRFHSTRHVMKTWAKSPFLFGYEPDELDYSFPDPPIPSEPHIVAIKNTIDLIKEGQELENCLIDVSYIEEIKKGSYFYKILNRYGIKDRATLLVSPTYDKDLQKKVYTIEEIHGKFNTPVHSITLKAVEDWLAIAQNLPDST